ncbi:MAG: hypothetical protein ACJAT2_000245 [Bacteriovoracaceae bacterium]|jgi:hypothetical protein
MKTEDTKPKASAPLSSVSRGFFSVKNQLYYSDGIDLYCGFKDWAHLESLTKGFTTKQKAALSISSEPDMMKFVPHCSKEIIEGKHTTKKAIERN